MKIELSISETEFLKGLVYKSDSWNCGGRTADVVFKLEEALRQEGRRLVRWAKIKSFFTWMAR